MSDSTPVSRELSSSRPDTRTQTRYGSRASSRPPRNSRNSSRVSVAYAPSPETLILPDGPIGEQATELLHELVHPQHRQEEGPLFEDNSGDGDGDDGDSESDASSVELRKTLPWYKRPSPMWLLVFIPIGAAAAGATLAPKIEIFTQIVCEVHRPEYTIGRGNDTDISIMGRSAIGFGTPNERRLCASDPVVEAEVAKLSMAMTTSLGVLSCLTTAWWGSLSDRRGRTRVLSYCIFGLLMTDVSFLLVSRYHKVLPGGYWFILIGPVLDGLLGGMTACTAAIHAYVADCTDAGSRSRIFSLIMGLMFIGIGLGPTFGSVVTHLTGSPLTVFYIATAGHLFFAAAVATVVPESLSLRRMMESRRLHNDALDQASRTPRKRGLWASFKKLFGFLTPLSLFYPQAVIENSNPLKRPKRDWNLVLLAIGFGCSLLIFGSYNYKFQYTSAVFGWTSEQNGYWLTIIGFTRAIYLTAILPLVIKLLKPKPKPAIQLSVSPDDPLQPDSPSTSAQEGEPSTPTKPDVRFLSFDLSLAQVSLAIEVVAYTLMAFAPNAPLYTIFTMIGCFGSGYSPAIQSVALGLYTQQGGKESGKLFGALAVVQALCSQIAGPALFGITFMTTAGTFPAAIFFVAAVAVTVALVILAFVRMPKEDHDDLEDLAIVPSVEGSEREDALLATDIPIIVVDEVNNKPSSPRS